VRRWAILGSVYVVLQVAALFVLPSLIPFTAAVVAQLLERLS